MANPAEKLMVDRNPIDVEPALARQGREPLVDLVHLSRQTLGDESLETELLSMFDRQAEILALRLRDRTRRMDGDERGDIAHTLKGSALAVGAFPLSRAADAYECAARAESPDAAARLAELQSAIEAARTVIGQLLERA
jgi:hypothetical protein